MNAHARIIMTAAALALGAAVPTACARPLPAAAVQTAPSPAMTELLDYLRRQNSTGFIVIRDGEVLIDQAWPAPATDRLFANFTYGTASSGALLEDVASQQKSFVAVLAAIAVDKGLLDVGAPVSTYLGRGWSKASPAQEDAIRVIDILTMSSGLDEQFAYVAPAGTTFFYNTPVYAVSKQIVAAAAKKPLETVTQDWLTAPLGMSDTAWRRRPAALASVGNDTGLVTTPQDVARFGAMVLADGLAADGARVVSQAQMDAMFERSTANPAYGRLWWLNGSEYVQRPQIGRSPGQLIPAAPADLVAALGAFDRRLYVVPSLKLVVVRTGAAASDRGFDQQVWLRLMRVLG
ncbi:serine hydrolase domain-containing protein [Brevundimonas sp. VNH65]|uniref:serine hydrolase domain-containing protein n=1 Tax=Brevundimonas sp. VNH65 TaxID=3400917 RepID=UPI003C129C2E